MSRKNIGTEIMFHIELVTNSHKKRFFSYNAHSCPVKCSYASVNYIFVVTVLL